MSEADQNIAALLSEERVFEPPEAFTARAVVQDRSIYERADAFLFGRRTYENFAGSWGAWPDPGDSPIWTALNTRPKYVASTTLTEPQWADTTVFSGDLAAAIGVLKAKPG